MSYVVSDAELGVLCRCAEAMFTDPAVIRPDPDPRLETFGWQIVDWITGVDSVFRFLGRGQRVFYGFLADNDRGGYAAVIRGTAGAVEWIEDVEGLLEPYPGIAAKAEAGFMGIRRTLELASHPGQPLGQAILGGIGDTPLVVTGHSLGAALATSVSLDCARPGGVLTRGRYFASPMLGDRALADVVGSAVPDHLVVIYQDDLVPNTPPRELGYDHVPRQLLLETHAGLIAPGPTCAHHVLTYVRLMDPDIYREAMCQESDREYAVCVLG